MSNISMCIISTHTSLHPSILRIVTTSSHNTKASTLRTVHQAALIAQPLHRAPLSHPRHHMQQRKPPLQPRIPPRRPRRTQPGGHLGVSSQDGLPHCRKGALVEGVDAGACLEQRFSGLQVAGPGCEVQGGVVAAVKSVEPCAAAD